MIRFATLPVLLFCFTTFTSADVEKRQSPTPTPTSSINYASLSAALESLVGAIPPMTASAGPPVQTVNLSNIDDPPPSLLPILITAVPMSVMWDILDPGSRSALASEFQHGSTPAWYQSLPTPVQSYLSVVHWQIQQGALQANISMPVATSTSSGKAALAVATPTGAALALNMVGALGVAGLAMVL